LKLAINRRSYIIKYRIPNSCRNIEEDNDEVVESNKFEEIDNKQSSTSAPLSLLSRTRDKLEEFAVEAVITLRPLMPSQ
jgi:hypothetical protein